MRKFPFLAFISILFTSSIALSAQLNLQNGAFITCDSTSGAMLSQGTSYGAYNHKQVSFSALIDSFGEMQMKAGDVLDFAPFKEVKGNAYQGNYYGRSIFSSFHLEANDGRFIFTQNMPGEALMITGICRYR